MDENEDIGGSAFEDRIRTLFEGGTSWRNVSAASVVRGARRRRVRHRATAAGASFAVLGVAAAGMVAFGGNPAGRAQATGETPTPTPTTTTTTTATPPAATSPTAGTPAPSTSSTSGAATCSASVSGTVPALTPTTVDGLDFETVSGSTAGIPWSVKIHAFPDWQTYLNWYKTQAPPRLPDSSSDSHPGQPPALFRQSGSPELMPVLIPGDSFGFVGHRLRGGADSPKKYVVQGWTAATIDHLCLQFAHHAEFEPVYRIQGGTFAVFGYTTADEPQKAIGYDAAGHVVATLDGDAGLLMPSGLQY